MDFLTLRFRLFGIGLHITPLFWLISGLLGLFILQGDVRFRAGPFLFFLMWLGCCLIGFLFHEIGSALAARIFGVRSTMVLGMGSTTVGVFSGLRLWQRIVIHLAGPLLGLGFYGFVVFFRKTILPEIHPLANLNPWVIRPIFFLEMLAFYYNLLSLLPLLPMNGGKVVMELLCALSPAKGMHWTHGWSFLWWLSFTLHAGKHWNEPFLELPFGIFTDPKFTTFIFAFFAVTNLVAFFQTWPPRSRPKDDYEVNPHEAV